jgi:ABC-type antimicrobial peptide transport system ATPase subunit
MIKKVTTSKYTKKLIAKAINNLKKSKSWEEWKTIEQQIIDDLTVLGYTWQERRELLTWKRCPFREKLYHEVSPHFEE